MIPRMEMDFFSDLPPSVYTSWRDLQSYKSVQKKETLFLEGTPVKGIYLLLQGRLKLFTSHPNGRNQLCGITAPGSFLAVSAAFRGTVHDCSCESLEESRLGFLDQEAFFEVLHQHPEFTRKITRSMAKEIHDLREHLSDLGCLSGKERLAATLLRLAQEYGRPTAKGILIDIPLSRRDIAETACLASETAIRQLSSLQKEGLIRSIRRKIILTDIKGLSQLTRGR